MPDCACPVMSTQVLLVFSKSFYMIVVQAVQAVLATALENGQVAWALQHLPSLYSSNGAARASSNTESDVVNPGVAHAAKPPSVLKAFAADDEGLCQALVAACTFTTSYTLEAWDGAVAAMGASHAGDQDQQQQSDQQLPGLHSCIMALPPAGATVA